MGDTSSTNLLEALKRIPGAVHRVYLAPRQRVMLMSLNKNACTSLKWMMADLCGEDLATFRAGWSPFIDDSEAVHNRTLWKVSPMLNRLTEQERAEIHPDNGWFIFAVVRDPRLRLFSAWQNRMLIETPNWRRFSNEPWYPRHPLTRETVIEDFARFVDLFIEEPDHWLRTQDAHCRDQVEMLAEHAVPYSRIYEISEMKQLQRDLAGHLEAQGHPSQLYLPRANLTPLRAISALYENGVREKLERMYAADFARFGHLWESFTEKVAAAKPWSDAELSLCEREAVLGRRIAELHTMACQKRDELKKATDQLASLQAPYDTGGSPAEHP